MRSINAARLGSPSAPTAGRTTDDGHAPVPDVSGIATRRASGRATRRASGGAGGGASGRPGGSASGGAGGRASGRPGGSASGSASGRESAGRVGNRGGVTERLRARHVLGEQRVAALWAKRADISE